MNKDRVEGKVKDVAGRIERQAGEWTDDKKKQAEGAMKQVEGKAQNTWGKVKDAAKDAADDAKKPSSANPGPNSEAKDADPGNVETADDVRSNRRKAS